MSKICRLNHGFQVISLALGPIQTNSHILYQKADKQEKGQAIIIDAPINSLESIRNVLIQEELDPKALLLTHGHWDHMGGAAALQATLNLPVWGSPADQLLFENPHIMSAFAGDFDLQAISLDECLDIHFDICADQAQNLDFTLPEWPELKITAMPMPGHTPGGLAYYFPQPTCVMTGDQLFQGSVGRSDFPGGNFEMLSASIRQLLYRLAPTTQVFPGHGAPTTIGQEMQHNPFVRP